MLLTEGEYRWVVGQAGKVPLTVWMRDLVLAGMGGDAPRLPADVAAKATTAVTYAQASSSSPGSDRAERMENESESSELDEIVARRQGHEVGCDCVFCVRSRKFLKAGLKQKVKK
jgi:hypothetical protein